MKKFIAANWKMYKTRSEAAETLRELGTALVSLPAELEIAVFAPFTALSACAEELKKACGKGTGVNIALGGQDVYPASEGAFTGEISPAMLLDCGCRFVLTGHSERRHLLGESDALVGRKTAFALENGLEVVLCVGEQLEEREAGRLEEVLARQLEEGLRGVDAKIEPARLSFAYEPVWAIGTGKVAGPAEIVEAHAIVRKLLQKKFSSQAAEMRILYGGSVKPENAGQIIGLDNVDGLLVGGASLLAESFSKIALA